MKWLSLVLIILLVGGCVSAQEDPELPPLPQEIYQLWQMYGEPEIYPGVSMTLVWNLGDVRLHILLAYDPFIGWVIQGYQMAGTASVPSEWALLMYRAWKSRQDREEPKDPWGRPLTQEAQYPERQ